MADKIRDSVVWNTVRDLLNKYGGKVVNTDTASAYDARGNINFDARYKPTKFSMANRERRPDSWWYAENSNCGVKLSILSSISELKGRTDAAEFWSHDYPTGGEDEPFFSGDFRGYNPNAKMISGAMVNPTSDVFLNNYGSASVCAIKFNENVGTDALDYTEIKTASGAESSLKDWYFGVIAIKTSGTAYGYVSLPYTLAELDMVTEDVYYAQDDHYAYVNLNGGIFPSIGEYDIYPVLFGSKKSASKSTSDVSFGDGYIPLPVKPIRINVIAASSLYRAEITSVSLSGNTLTVNYTVTAVSGSSLVFGPTNNTPTLEVRAYTDIAEGKEVFPYDGNTFGDFMNPNGYTVPANGSINCSDSVNILSPTGYKYLSVSIRWPQGFGATKMDIEI